MKQIYRDTAKHEEFLKKASFIGMSEVDQTKIVNKLANCMIFDVAEFRKTALQLFSKGSISSEDFFKLVEVAPGFIMRPAEFRDKLHNSGPASWAELMAAI